MEFERLFEAFPPGFHSYHPFGAENDDDAPTPPLRNLQDRCKHAILRLLPLTRLRRDGTLGLPGPLLRFLRQFGTDDFVEVERAPLVDIFEFNFYHRAMTYKVRSKYDRCEYLATHGFTTHDTFDPRKVRERDMWINASHDHLMFVCGTVTDEDTGNVFYLLPVPQVSLEHVQKMLVKSKTTVPEVELWKLAYHLSSVLLHIQSLGLCYGAFGLDNVFLVDDEIVLENELTRKSRMYLLSRVDTNLWKRIPSEPWHRPQSTPEECDCSVLQSNETHALWYLGYILEKLADVQRGDDEPLLFHLEMSENEPFYARNSNLCSGASYSDELCQLIVDSQTNVTGKLTLLHVQRLSSEMIELQKQMDDEGKAHNGLLELAKEEFAVWKQSRWR